VGVLPPEGSPPTARELTVLGVYAILEDYRLTAEALGISVGTVRAHLENVRSRFGCRTSLGAYARAVQRGYIRIASEAAA